MILRFDRELSSLVGEYGFISLAADTFADTVAVPFAFSSGWKQLTVNTIPDAIESWPGVDTSLIVNIGSGIVTDKYSNQPNTVHSLPVSYAEEFRIVDAEYDAAHNDLYLAFNHRLNDYATDDQGGLLDLFLSTGQKITVATPFDWSTGSTENDNTLIIHVDSLNALTLETWNVGDENPMLSVGNQVFFSFYNDTFDLTDSIAVNYKEKVSISDAVYSTFDDRLTLVFDHALCDTALSTSSAITLSVDDAATSEYTLSLTGYSYGTGSAADDDTIQIHLTSTDASVIETWPGLDSILELHVMENTFFDTSLTKTNETVYFDMDRTVSVVHPVKLT
ncbi:MAG: hypothetical protein ACOCW2_02080, partial [Chitinivibrionales bacterium]